MTRIRNAPNASALMATARSFGNYDLAGALADIIDNSIAAQAINIDIECDYMSDGSCSIRIRDDGKGMDKAELIQAMCPASTHPEDERAADDLGRFGWGMKSASFSQCRVLTVISTKEGRTCAAKWDLDSIDNWEMDFFEGDEATALMSSKAHKVSGTELMWTNCDRLSEGKTVTRDQFAELIVVARDGLSQVFHRFLNRESGQSNRIHIRLNGTELIGFDPFCQTHVATIPHPEEPIDFTSDGKLHRVKMQAFVLPHYSKLTQSEHDQFGGKEGYIRNQGFYVYRNRRLIISGTWFGLAKHGEFSKLVRVRIDIPNSLDEIWKITLDKSDAQLPVALKKRMKDLIGNFRNTSHRVHRSKGAKMDHGAQIQVWSRHVRQGVIKYSINSKHPLLSALTDRIDVEDVAVLDSFLTMLESQLPIDAISNEIETNAEQIQRGFVSRDELKRFLRQSLPGLMSEANTPEKLNELVKITEPFASNINVVNEELQRIFGHD